MSPKSDSLKAKSGLELKAQAAALRQTQAAPVAQAKTRREQLDEYREVVVTGQRNFVNVGTALGLIAKERLFKEAGHPSFEAMVAADFDMSATTAYRLVDAARVVTILSQVGAIQSKIRNQSQALALAPLGKDREAMVLVITSTEARVGKLTAELLAAVRVELYPHTRVIDGEVVPERAPLVGAIRAAIEGVEHNHQTAAGVSNAPADGRSQAAPAQPERALPAASDGGANTVGGGNPQDVPGKSAIDNASGVGEAGVGDQADRPAPAESPEEQERIEEEDSSAGRDLEASPETSAVATTGQPEDSHRDAMPGEADGPPANAGPSEVRPPAQGYAGDEVGPEGPAPEAPSGPTVGGQGWAGPVPTPVELLEELAEKFQALDVDVLAPLMTSAQLDAMQAALKSVTFTVGMFETWYERTGR